MRRSLRFAAVLSPLAATLAIASGAIAQPVALAAPPLGASATQPAPAPAAKPETPALPAALQRVLQALAPEPGGITGEAVGRRAADTSFSAKAAAEQLRSAAARVDQSWSGFLPRLTLNAQYTRLSNFTPPSFGGGSGQGSIVVSPLPPGTVNPDQTITVAANQGLSIPLVLNQWALSAQIAVPISDYFLRINQGYTASTHALEATRQDLVTARARSASEASIAFYNYLRARGGVVIAEQALVNVQTHAVDAGNQFKAGNASRADVLRAETQIAAAELTVARVKNLVALLDKQVRQAVHAKEGENFKLGEDLSNPPTPPNGELRTFVSQALAARPELKSVDANIAALRKAAGIARAGSYPRVAAFGEATLANPNQRRFPQTQDWFPTWAVGVQASWSPNDLVSAQAGGHEADARVAAIEAQKIQLAEGIELEVTQALQAFEEAQVEIAVTRRQVQSAEEAQRVAHELFINGRATATLVTDAETELTKSRLEAVNASIDAFVTRTRFEHAIGRDLRYLEAEPQRP